MNAALELAHNSNTFDSEPYFHNIQKIIDMNKYAAENSYRSVGGILPKFNSDLKELLDKYTKIPAEHMYRIVKNTHMPIKYRCGEYGYSPEIQSPFIKWGFRGNHNEILNKIPEFINQINDVYKTLYKHPFEYIKLTFYCGKCKKVNETFFPSMPHPSIHITCPICLTEKLIPIHNNEEYHWSEKSNYRKYAYSENEYHPLQIEGVILGTFKEDNVVLKSLNS
jgi:hypothetical protein